MTDLVRKLRENAEIVPHDCYTWFNPLLNEAADEIDRLENLALSFLAAWNMGEEPDEGTITDARKILFKRGAPANEE